MFHSLLFVSLAQLTATKAGRQTLKDKSVYPIMREFHNWEKDVHVTAACEKLVQVGKTESLLFTESPLMLLVTAVLYL